MPVSDFSFLYLNSYPYLYRLVASITHNSGLVEDILQEFVYSARQERFQVMRERVRLSELPPAQQAICRVLLEGEADADLIAERSGLSVPVVNSTLTALLFSGIMKQLPGRVYALDELKTRLVEE